MLKPGMFISDRYEIIDKVGSGGMADVYKARDHRLNRFVAIKVLKPEYSNDKSFVNKFRGEAQSAAGLSHPNIVNVYDVGDDNGLYYIVMELVEGITLKRFIERKGKLEVKEAVGIAIQIAQGMEAAHDNRIIHRDIKPQNIIISRDGKVKVTDFGIAKATNSNTITSNAMGSVHYLSPEQARGGYSDEKSDIYSLGVTIYEMLSGKVPFAGDNTVSVALLHIQSEAMPLRELDPNIPVSVDKIVQKCMQKRPEKRYHSASELIADLKRALTNPDGDFVQIPTFVALDSPTINISDDLGKIKKNTFNADDTRPTKNLSAATAKTGDDDEDLDAVDSKMEKVVFIGSIITIVILCLLIIGIVLYFIFPKKGDDNTDEDDITPSIVLTPTPEPEVSTAPTPGITEPTTYIVPDVEGLTEEDAKVKIRNEYADADIRTGEDYSNTVEKGKVIQQYPPGGTKNKLDDIVHLTISIGPEAFDVPDVYGLTQRQADIKLEEKGLKTLHEFVFSDDVAADKVIYTTPERGASVVTGDTVTVYVSKGPENAQVTPTTPTTPDEPEDTQVAVPKLLGLTKDQASKALADLGLELGEIEYATSGIYPDGQVSYQNYSFGEKVEKGTKIDIQISTGQPSYRGSVNINENPIYYLEDGETVEIILEMTQNGEQSEIYQGPMSNTEFPFTFNDFYSSSSDTATVVMYIDGIIYTRSGETEPATWIAEFTAEE
jgi:serine/threonine-protein kinase